MLSGLLLVGDVEAVTPMCSFLIWVLFKFCKKEHMEMAITVSVQTGHILFRIRSDTLVNGLLLSLFRLGGLPVARGCSLGCPSSAANSSCTSSLISVSGLI